MVVYNFKRIQPVPKNSDFIDIVLTRTQRKTPTVVHSSWKITRIREFYMRKVRFTQQTFHDKLSLIVDEFPKLDVSVDLLLQCPSAPVTSGAEYVFGNPAFARNSQPVRV
jgi:hypothetical protein